MSVRRLAAVQPKAFAFTPENLDWAQGQIAKYPERRQASAVIPLLWKAQEQHGGWLPEPAIRVVADLLGMPYIRVLEVATFYTMFSLEPVGRHFVQVCGTTPCMLRGAGELKDACRRVIGPERKVSEDGALSWMEVECLGACANAPMVQINADYYEDLDGESLERLLETMRAGGETHPGSQTGRTGSAPVGGPTTLSDAALYDGSVIGAWRKRFEPAPAEAVVTPDAPGKPAEGSPTEEKVADSPARRAAEGKEPVKPADRAEAGEAADKPSVEPDAARKDAAPVTPAGDADGLKAEAPAGPRKSK